MSADLPVTSSELHVTSGSATSGADKRSAENSSSESVTVDSNNDEVKMDVDAEMEVDKPAATAQHALLPEVIELATVDSQLNIDADSDDWLTRLLRYDNENTESNNSDS